MKRKNIVFSHKNKVPGKANRQFSNLKGGGGSLGKIILGKGLSKRQRRIVSTDRCIETATLSRQIEVSEREATRKQCPCVNVKWIHRERM